MPTIVPELFMLQALVSVDPGGSSVVTLPATYRKPWLTKLLLVVDSIEKCGLCAGHVEEFERSVNQRKAVAGPNGIDIIADHHVTLIDCVAIGFGGAGNVDRDEAVLSVAEERKADYQQGGKKGLVFQAGHGAP